MNTTNIWRRDKYEKVNKMGSSKKDDNSAKLIETDPPNILDPPE
jgi:hypothetical protein